MSNSKYRKLITEIEPPILLVLVLGILFMGLVISSDWMWRNQIRKNVPLYDNLKQIRMSLTKGQLMLESILAGDRSIRPEDIWPLYDKSELAVRDCINGRSTIINLSGIPTKDSEALIQLAQLERSLKRFRKLALARWKERESTDVRNTLDERALFYQLERSIDIIDYHTLKNIGKMMDDQKKIHLLVLMLWLLILSGVCGILFITGKKRRLAEAELQKAHDELELTVKERTAELIVANKQLKKEIEERRQAEEVLESERDKLKALLDGLASTNIGVDIVSTDYEVLQQNQTLIDRFGNIVGKKCYKEYMALEEPCSFCPMVKALESKRLERAELRGADGRDYEILAAPITNPDGTVDKAIEVVQDITDRKRAEEALRESEALLKKSQEIAHIGSWKLDLVANRLAWSDEVYRMFGLRPQEFDDTYEAFLDTVHPDDRASVDAAYSGSLREGRYTYEIEHRIVRQDSGEIRVVHEKCEHIKDVSGRIVRSVGMVQDITERKRMEEEREKLIKELREALKEVKTLRGILPLCSFCKKIRDDKGYWEQVDVYIHKHSQADISHSICPNCAKEHYPDLDIYDD